MEADYTKGCGPVVVEIGIFDIPYLKNFFHNCPYNERSQSDQGLGIPHQAAFNRVTCFRSFHPSIRRM